MRWIARGATPIALLVLALGLLMTPGTVVAQDAAVEATAVAAEAAEVVAEVVEEAAGSPVDASFIANNLWIMIAGMLVFIMHLGFATLETGLTRSKNTINILFKNTMIVCIGILTYALIGFNLMYPGFDDESMISGILDFGAISGFITSDTDDLSLFGPDYAGYTWYTDFFFQAMFAATCCTIVSGAVAERIKLSSFLLFATLFVAIAYPITGAWQWGGGFLSTLGNEVNEAGELINEAGFYDFAGSTIVHSVGGWAALVMVILLGPRLGKYNADGSSNAIPGHNLTLAAIGVFLLWFGWFGFNGGSVLSADPTAVSLVLVTTSMAAAAGGVAAGLVSWFAAGKPDLSMALNGVLAGLVGITAGADQMAIWESVVIGGIAGVLVYFSVIAFDRVLKIDDPVGATSVHLVCGIWGTLAVGIFGAKAGIEQFGYQLAGVAAMGAFTVVFTLVVGFAIKAAMGLRVSDEEQIEGLDLGEHDMAAYPDFQQTTIKSYQLREV
jgi:Amt family ammonium transporter